MTMTKVLRALFTRISSSVRVHVDVPSLQPIRAISTPSQTSWVASPAVRPPFCLRQSSVSLVYRSLCNTLPKQAKQTVAITFVDRDGDEHTVQAKVGDSLLEVAKEFDIDVEGACEGTLSCSTCHLIVEPEWFKKIPDPLTEEEQDMLDLAYQPTDTSRLGCQILVSKDLEGLKVTVPSATRDIRNT